MLAPDQFTVTIFPVKVVKLVLVDHAHCVNNPTATSSSRDEVYSDEDDDEVISIL